MCVCVCVCVYMCVRSVPKIQSDESLLLSYKAETEFQ